MPKVSIANAGQAPLRESVAGCIFDSGMARALFDGPADPIHAHVFTIRPGGSLALAPHPTDRVAYIWEGDARLGATMLGAGSSFITERGAQGEVAAGEGGATIVTFAAAAALADARAGGALHALPAGAVPRFTAENGLTGALHADGACPTCSAWLHENAFPPPAATAPQSAEAGIHCHSESEVIFVAAGAMRLGAKLVGPGTAIAIAADTMYSFLPGPEGLHFINFRAQQPSDIRFKNGPVMDEVAYWRDRVPSPVYL